MADNGNLAIEYIPKADLKPDIQNANEMTDRQRGMLKKSLKRFGFVEPIVVNSGKSHGEMTNRICGGHHRVDEYPDDMIPCVFVDLDERYHRMLSIALNQQHGQFNTEKIKGQLNALATLG
ncbi:unnamed protein product, partial [marine sediment metagenome]